MDKGQEATDKILADAEKRINSEYKKAIEEIEEKLQDHLAKFEVKDKKWAQWVDEGTKTAEEYYQWRVGQMAVGKRWSDQKEAIAKDLYQTNENAKEIIKSVCPEVYAENFNFSTYQIESDASIDTAFTLYSKESVERLVKDNPQILPNIGKTTAKKIAEGKAVKWNRQQLQSVMLQGLLQGESIPKLATRLANTVGEKNRKAAIRNARTMATSTQNAGRVDAYKRAQDKGVELEQMWMAVMDNRTRHSHRWIDGEIRPVGEAFSNGCEYPADPKGDPAEVYNCRCTLRAVVKGLERRSYVDKDMSALGGKSYEDWKYGKSKSQDITAQEEKGKSAQRKYVNEYKKNGKIEESVKKRGQIDTGYKGEVPRSDLEKYYKQGLNQIIEDTGYSESEAKNFQDALIRYFGGEYEEISTAPNSETAKTIINGLAKLPAYEGTITRGIAVSQEKIESFMQLKAGDSITTKGIIESWSSDEAVAKSYAHIGASVESSSIIFECRENTLGKGTQHLSKYGTHEAEVTVANPNYEVVEVITESKYDYLSKHQDELYLPDDLVEEEKALKENYVCRIIVKEKN